MEDIEYQLLLEDLDRVSNKSTIVESLELEGSYLVMKGVDYTSRAHKLVESLYNNHKYVRFYNKDKTESKIIDTSKYKLEDLHRMITRYYRFGKILEAWQVYVKDSWSFQDYLDNTYPLINFDDKGYASWVRPNGKIYDTEEKLHPDMFAEMGVDSSKADDYANDLGLVRFNTLGHNYIRLPDNYFTDNQLKIVGDIIKYCLDTNKRVEVGDYHNHYLQFKADEVDYKYVLMVVSNFYRTGKITNDLNESRCPTCSTLLESNSISVSYDHRSYEDICPKCKILISSYNNGSQLVTESIRRLSEAYLDPEEKFYDYRTSEVDGKNLFDTNKTGTSYYDDVLKNPEYMRNRKGVQGEIVMMTPTEYFDACGKGFGNSAEVQLEYTANDEDVINHLKEVILKYKRRFPLTYLNYSGNSFAQEGKHRMYVAGELAGWDTKQPVLIITDAEPEEIDPELIDNGEESNPRYEIINKINNKIIMSGNSRKELGNKYYSMSLSDDGFYKIGNLIRKLPL